MVQSACFNLRGVSVGVKRLTGKSDDAAAACRKRFSRGLERFGLKHDISPIFLTPGFRIAAQSTSFALRDEHKRLLILMKWRVRMKATRTILAVALVTMSLPGFANDAAQSGAQSSPVPANTQEWVKYLSDFTRNGDMLADPKKFIAALAAVSEPEFLIEAGKAMMDPNLYLQSTSSLMDPRAYGNFAKAMDPVVLASWSQALMDPQFIAAATTVMTDPNKLMRWMMAPVDPRALGMLLSTLNPNTYLKFAGAALDPRMLNMATAPLNPSWYGGWLGNMASPQAYGPTVNSLFQAPAYGGQMGGFAPTYPQAFPTIPLIDPRLFGGTMPIAPR
jgi:hypothetical protein